MTRPFSTALLAILSLSAFSSPSRARADESDSPPLHALLIAGGCCHDYASQQSVIAEGIQARANVRVDVYWTDNSTTAPILPLYRKLNWAEDYDVIIHDECAADIKDEALVNRIVGIHQKLPAVHLHCAMHSFRTGTDAWFAHLGIQSSGHGPQEPIDIHFVVPNHPITKTCQDWTTIGEELYNNVKVLGAQPLAIGTQKIGGNNPRTDEAIVAWTNETQGARSFSTTIGHNTETVQDPRYLELVTRGLLWSCGKLNDEYLTPYQGENETTFIDQKKYRAPEATDLGTIPDDATLVKMTASSTQNGHPAYHAIDGERDTRFCADGGSYPQWLQFEFEQPQRMDQIRVLWEDRNAAYRYLVEGSNDGKSWSTLLDESENTANDRSAKTLSGDTAIKFVRIHGLGGPVGKWCSIREVNLIGKDLGTLWPADTKADANEFVPLAADRYQNQGNVPPRIEKLTAEAEADILRDVRIPDGFTATVFASPPAVNYPVFVAADVDGTLYVSSDGNGSLGRNPERGRVIRLRDLDGDGRADETKVFCEVDAPRGLLWDHDRLYLMHPPNLSVFFDHDGDGVADEQKTLVKGLAFDYADRPADHTTNGLSLGADGWLYIAGGDFGFLEAVGSDGTKLTHRGGGVIRVRPDGSDLEIYSAGTRNILEVAISPEMEMFARDNTNDGGGWDVRLHHFTGMENHGYPRLYKNFNDECVQPLADYGGGSGCGAVYIDEPGFGDWNHAPFTADWGTGSLYRHTVTPSGASYQESEAPESFIKMTRPTDADVDGNSRVYCASWMGATFNWGGPDVGYIVCVRPDDFTPPPMPEFSAASDDELTELMESPSYRRRIAAQRELMRRGNPASEQLLTRAIANRAPARNLLLHLQTEATDQECVSALSHADPVVVHTAIRCLADRNAAAECFGALDSRSGSAATEGLLRALAMMHTAEVVDGLISRLAKADDDLKTGIVAALCRLHSQEAKWKGDSWGTRPDTRGPYYEPVPWSESEKIASVLKRALPEIDPQVAADVVRKHYYLGKEIYDAGDAEAETPEPTAPTWSPEEIALLEESIPSDAVKISTLSLDSAADQAVRTEGNVELGKYVFTKANCVACHTVSEDEKQKGPFLGSIAKTYKRPDLAVAVLQPSKTIAQGFVTNTILTLDGELFTGFVTNERSEQVTLRDQNGKETTIDKEEIDFRKTSEVSVMPTGVLNEFTTYEFASLLDYMESLSQKSE
ncbi:DUF7133 domain-containing protein [Allorhodopirellula solitaria]|uniref:Trehalose utilization n=1 Tax=Allorhodopirellula solitaria TaxID=2527987 RepID=A0A5C5YGJ0_9BACT|nr:discoidin domain-containing protein [Allorhodopirellula solitaria]TWT74268.1 Trehalose utilization [Allorhodopirellula solitaria]